MSSSVSILPWVVLLPFIGAVFAAYFARFNRLASAYVAGGVTLLAIGLIAPMWLSVFDTGIQVVSWAWLPALGLDWAFRMDGLAMLFSGLILIIGLLIIIYARYYLASGDCMGRFFAYLLMFMGSMLGIVLSENLIQLVIFWELTSLTSFLLISYWQHRQDARRGARMALTITGAGGLALLGGVLLLGHVVGSYQLTDVLAAGDVIRSSEWYGWILGLVLLGVFTKSAQFPFHFWLPHAMAAPTPVSAYLHSATMVKAGIFLLARLYPSLAGTPEWSWWVGSAGMATLLIGAYTALFKHDLKGLLAYSTLSHLGLITLLLGFGTEFAVVAAIFHIINHATFKASLFMVAGIIDHETGSRDMRKLNGLLKYMPHTALLAMVASAAMAGVPLLNGFLSKEMFFEQAVNASNDGSLAWLIPVLVTLAAVFSVAYSLRFIHDVFFNGEPIDLPKTPHEPPRFMKIPVDILVIACIAVGLFPALTVAPILTEAVSGALQADAPAFSLAIWHGFTLPLWMSIAALVLGVLVYVWRQPLFDWHDRGLDKVSGKSAFESLMRRMIGLANGVTRAWDRQRLDWANIWVILVAIGLPLYALGVTYGFEGWLGERIGPGVDGVSLLVAGVMLVASAYLVLFHHQRLTALIATGVLGLGVALIFVRFSAPDLALTQISVEVVSIILLLLALFFLPQHSPKESSALRKWRDAGIAVVSGVAVSGLMLAVLSRDYAPISDYFMQNALPGGGGTNVVNVILVDFRGIDTLGEIVVLALAGLSVFALLQGLRLPQLKHNEAGLGWTRDAHPLIMQTLTRLLLPMMLMVAVFVFLRGHNLPGGGFIAGLIASVALIVQYLSNGLHWSQARMPFDWHGVIGAGLLIAAGTGIVAMFLGYPFLTSTFTHLHWPLVGEFEIASAMAFDLGVFLVVLGSTVLALSQLGELSHHSPVEEDEQGGRA
jgi:multicomponent K+:H+ antiporter subunit A